MSDCTYAQSNEVFTWFPNRLRGRTQVKYIYKHTYIYMCVCITYIYVCQYQGYHGSRPVQPLDQPHQPLDRWIVDDSKGENDDSWDFSPSHFLVQTCRHFYMYIYAQSLSWRNDLVCMEWPSPFVRTFGCWGGQN